MRAGRDQKGDDAAGVDEDERVAGVEEDAFDRERSRQKKTGSL
jgi:hypothetical protein